MEQVVIAFEGEKTTRRFADIIESEVAECLVCHTPAEVKRMICKRELSVVVCGYKLKNQTAEEMMDDLPETTIMLMIAAPSQLDFCTNEDIFRLAAPVSRGDLIASVRLALQMARRLEHMSRPQRNDAEKELINQAKQLLMEQRGLTEDQAHRLIQKRSMDAGVKMIQSAREILVELEQEVS